MFALLLLLGVQIGPAAGTPNRQPQLAARDDAVGVAYGAGNAIYFAASTDGAATFGPPVLVSSQGELALGMHRGPRIAYTGQGIVISAVVGQQGAVWIRWLDRYAQAHATAVAQMTVRDFPSWIVAQIEEAADGDTATTTKGKARTATSRLGGPWMAGRAGRRPCV